MRCGIVFSVVAFALVSCKEPDPPAVAPDTHAEAASSASKTLATSEPAPSAVAEPAPSSPFLVQPTPTTQPTPDATQPAAPPTTQPLTTSTNNTGKPCAVGRCLLDGKCVIPGGPVARPGAPADAVSGACGGDGGPCSRCRCVSTGTLLSTPNGETPIEDLHTNDIVWSMHQGKKQAVRILATQRVHVHDHSMARIQLQNGFVVEISGEHPTGDGRSLWDLKPGEMLGNAQIESLSVVPYTGSFTYDILPDSDSGTYFVHGMWLGSTMLGQNAHGDMTDTH